MRKHACNTLGPQKCDEARNTDNRCEQSVIRHETLTSGVSRVGGEMRHLSLRTWIVSPDTSPCIEPTSSMSFSLFVDVTASVVRAACQ
jgi:hypothetical protein